MDHDAFIRLDVYVDSAGSRIGDLKSYRTQDELLIGLCEVAHAASGSDTLDMVCARSEAERADSSWEKTSFGFSRAFRAKTCMHASPLSPAEPVSLHTSRQGMRAE
jgi:hypothetical protein